MATDSTTTLNGLLTALEECPLSSPPLLSYGDDVHRECSDYGLILNASLEEGSYFSASFNNLKSLILCVTMAEWTVPLIIRLLNRSPNLEALTIYFDAGEYFDEWKISNKAILCLTCHLKTVDLVEFKGHENELELVRFLLKNGHVLQKLRISWLEDVYNRREIISRIMKFPRSSSSVILKFLQPKSPFDFCEILR
ncbi:hypothetical protein WN943_002001 [Citrus x changshan-huyou]